MRISQNGPKYTCFDLVFPPGPAYYHNMRDETFVAVSFGIVCLPLLNSFIIPEFGKPENCTTNKNNNIDTTFPVGVWCQRCFGFVSAKSPTPTPPATPTAPDALKNSKQLCFCLLICGCLSAFFVVALRLPEVFGFDFIAGFVYFLWLGLVSGYLLPVCRVESSFAVLIAS